MRGPLPLLTVLTLPVILLTACSEDPTVVDVESTTSEAPAGEDTDEAVATTDGAQDGLEEDDQDGATATEGPDSGGTTESAAPPTRAERQAARRAEQWLVAFVRGEDEVCDYMLDLSGEGAMKDSESDYALCVEMIPPLAQEQFDTETAKVIELVEITGADVDGDRAVITRDHFSELFAKGIADQRIELRRVEGTWYVDLENSF